MLKIILASLGLIGGIIGLSGFYPQAVKIFKIKKSSQFSVLGWSIWVVSGIFLLIYALSIKDPVYITLEILNTLSLLFIFILILVFRKK